MDPPVEDLTELPLGELMERFAATTPAPGGGSAIAVGCALAAALVEMAAGFSAAPEGAGVAARAAELRVQALELANLELDSYAPVLEALRRPASDAGRAPSLREALSNASAAPLKLAGLGAELAELAARAAAEGSLHLVGDVSTAALLAEAACRGAARLVQVNLAGEPGDPRLQRTAELTRHAAAAREAALAAGFGGAG